MQTNNSFVSSKAIRLLLVGDSSVGKTTFILQLTQNGSLEDILRKQQQPTVGAQLYSSIHTYSTNQNSTIEYFVDWLDIGSKYFDVLKANEVFFSSYNGIVFMFDMYDSNSLKFWENVSKLIHSTRDGRTRSAESRIDSTVTVSNSSTYFPTTVTNPILRRQMSYMAEQETKRRINLHNDNSNDLGLVPVLIIGNHCSQFTGFLKANQLVESLDLPLLNGDNASKLAMNSSSSLPTQSLFRKMLNCFTNVVSFSLFVLSKVFLMSDYFPTNETSQRNIARTRSLASKLQHSLHADYMELDSSYLTASQRRLVDNFLDRVIFSGYEN
jgi:hypothetical protein